MKILQTVRPSNLVLLAAVPFIALLFFGSSKYTRSLFAILGIGPNAGPEFAGFLLLTALGALAYLPFYRARPADPRPALDMVVPAGIVLQFAILGVMLIQPSTVAPFVTATVAHSVDVFTSDWIVPTIRPRQLTPEISVYVMAWFRGLLWIYGGVLVVLVAATNLASPWPERARLAMMILGVVILAYLAFGAHWGFAAGIAVTFRATIFAYALAAIVGLCWTGLTLLKPGRRTTAIYGAISVVLLLVAAFFYAQPKETYLLVGSTEARIAIIKGTPQSLADTIRFGEYPGGEGISIRIRSTPNVAGALELVRADSPVSGAFIPADADRGDLPVLWEVTFLPQSARFPALAFSVLGILLGVLTIGAHQHGLHPLGVGAEFFVDTIRGIPMLVIILYVGLPLSGAVKDATAGVIDLPNMTRGIIAIAIGYSAYMAEIFRAGIEAVPKGQVEAAGSLGLSRWKIARLVMLPQALRIVVPPLGNEFIAMIKDTSLLSILSVRDLTQRMREFQSASFLPFAPFNTAAIVYVIITLGCASFLKWIERRHDIPV